MARRVAVVGAGSSGLACVKICVEEGLEPVCFESSDDIGGLWRFKVSEDTVLKSIPHIKKNKSSVSLWYMNRDCAACVTMIIRLNSKISLSEQWFCFPLCPQESPEPDRSSMYRSLVVNTSKEMMCFSDFPMAADYPNYMHNSQLLQYFRLYAEHFDLLKYIHFQVIPFSSCVFLQFHTIYVKSKLLMCVCVYVCVNVDVHASDHSKECYTKTGLLSVRSVGHSDH